MDTLLCQFMMVGGLSFVFFGLINSEDKFVTIPKQITAWNDSCVKVPCEVKGYIIQYTYAWFQNPVYNDSQKEFEGKVAFNSSNEGMSHPSFRNRVSHTSESSTSCTILIKNLQHEDAGIYKVRLWPKESNRKELKWMSENELNLTVSDYGHNFKINPAELKTQESRWVKLVCSLSYSCPENELMLSWTGNTKGKGEFSTTPDMEIMNKLSFTASWADHNKTFNCVLSRLSTELESRSIVLNVEYAPKGVTISPNNSTFMITKGEKLILECVVQSSNPGVETFSWYETSKWDPVNKNKNYTVTQSGTYRCEAQNKVGKGQSNNVKVQVLYAPESVTISLLKGEIKEGEPVSLKCSASAYPPVSNYIWYKNEVQAYDKTGPLYNFTPTEYDSGSYVCEAYNKLGSKKSSPLVLNVKYPPKYPELTLYPEGTSFNTGEDVIFYCTVNRSNPEVSSFTWYQNDKPLSSSLSPLSLKLMPKHSGKYKCQAKNEAGIATSQAMSIIVRYPPKEVKVENAGPAPVIEGQTILLKCTASESEPKVKDYQWYKNENPYRNDSNYIPFNGIKWTDSGDYLCEAKHDLGHIKSKPVTIDVLYAPCNMSISVVPYESVTEYSLVKIICNVKSNPKPGYFTWYKNDAELREYDQILSLDNIKLDGEGTYQCSATNTAGTGQSDTVYIRVSFSIYTIIKYVSGAVGLILLLLVIVVLSIRFKIWTKFKRQARDDISDSSFFVLKKSHSESPEGVDRQCPPECMSEDQLDYASIQFAAPNEGEYQVPRKPVKSQDANDIYSIVKKPRTASVLNEYENVPSSKNSEDNKEELHYSTITNLTKVDTVRHNEPGVEYAMLRH